MLPEFALALGFATATGRKYATTGPRSWPYRRDAPELDTHEGQGPAVRRGGLGQRPSLSWVVSPATSVRVLM